MDFDLYSPASLEMEKNNDRKAPKISQDENRNKKKENKNKKHSHHIQLCPSYVVLFVLDYFLFLYPLKSDSGRI